MISLDYLIFYISYLSVLILVFASIYGLCEKLKEKIWVYNKKEIENILNLYCKKAKIFQVDQEVEIFSYRNFTYSNSCGNFQIRKGKHKYVVKS